jgi:hypothetical protein
MKTPGGRHQGYKHHSTVAPSSTTKLLGLCRWFLLLSHYSRRRRHIPRWSHRKPSDVSIYHLKISLHVRLYCIDNMLYFQVLLSHRKQA